jgi:hypothetical protein
VHVGIVEACVGEAAANVALTWQEVVLVAVAVAVAVLCVAVLRVVLHLPVPRCMRDRVPSARVVAPLRVTSLTTPTRCVEATMSPSPRVRQWMWRLHRRWLAAAVGVPLFNWQVAVGEDVQGGS